jgi:3D (Asp-Asp-Asp) domain-containing protein
MSKNAVSLLPFFILGAVMAGLVVVSNLAFGKIVQKGEIAEVEKIDLQTYNISQDGFLLAKSNIVFDPQSGNSVQKNVDSGIAKDQSSSQKYSILISGYSSSPEETDDTPFITASGSFVRDGIVAANFLPFGTLVRFPKLFGDKIFVVEDRLHSKYNDRVDIWFSSREEALQFGVRMSEIEIIDNRK